MNRGNLGRMAFEVACVVADHRPGMLRDDASDFISVTSAFPFGFGGGLGVGVRCGFV